MSRRNTSSKKSTALPGSDLTNEQRQFLIRSLERNDLELAALIDLHRSLHAVKHLILKQCGEITLLDLGEGRLELGPTNDSLQIAKNYHPTTPSSVNRGSGSSREKNNNNEHKKITPTTGDGGTRAMTTAPTTTLPPPEGQHLCVDFLLRMKLRRRLLNRLARRLLRVAHSMDGNDVQPPPPPKYGDLRLHIDPVAVESFAVQWKLKEEAKRKIALAREDYAKPSIEWTVANREPSGTVEEQEEDGSRNGGDNNDESMPTVPSSNEIVKDTKIKQEQATETTQSTYEDQQGVNGEEQDDDDPLEACYEVLRDYKDVYEKFIEVGTGVVKFPNLNPDEPEDYEKVKFGVGALQANMTPEEKELEFKRWRSALLSRIPEQPTFDELGLKNRVFFLEERRRQALEKLQQEEEDDIEDDDTASGKRSMDENKDDEKTDDSDSAATEKEQNDDNTSHESSAEEATNKRKFSSSEDKSKSNSQEAEDLATEPLMKDETEPEANQNRKRPITLLPVPSFYDQDLKRIRMIQADLVMASMHDDIRRRLEEATREYNLALARSNDLYERQVRITNQQNEVRSRMVQMKNDYSIQMNIAKSQYLQRRRIFEDKKLSSLLPSRCGRQPLGTRMTQAYAHRNILAMQVSGCLADVVDAVDNIYQGMAINEIFAEIFVPPPSAPVEQHVAMEEALNKEAQATAAKLRTSEEDRHRHWKKILKTKTEFETSTQTYGSYRSSQDSSRQAAIQAQAPPLRHTTPQTLPGKVRQAAASTYTPAVRTPRVAVNETSPSVSQSKYSAARVRQRISSDGSVAPVSEPKRTKDGLFQRPAGRTRKGMEWDALRGIWIPAGRGDGDGQSM